MHDWFNFIFSIYSFLICFGVKLLYNVVLVSMYSEKATIIKDTYIPMFIVELFTKARTWKQSRCLLTDEWIKSMQYIYTMEHCSAIKKVNLSQF